MYVTSLPERDLGNLSRLVFIERTVNEVRVIYRGTLFAFRVMGLLAAVAVSEISWEVT